MIKIGISGLLVAAVVFLFFRGKTNTVYGNSEFLQWLSENKETLTKKSEFEKLVFTARYLPPEYVMLKDDPNIDFTSSKSMHELEAYSKSVYFSFEIKSTTKNDPLHEGAGSAMLYNARLKYFSFDAQQDFKLISGNDTLDCKLYHMERMYNAAPYLRMSLVFEKTNDFKTKDFILTCNERELGMGRLNFYYDIDEINNIPIIKKNEQ